MDPGGRGEREQLDEGRVEVRPPVDLRTDHERYPCRPNCVGTRLRNKHSPWGLKARLGYLSSDAGIDAVREARITVRPRTPKNGFAGTPEACLRPPWSSPWPTPARSGPPAPEETGPLPGPPPS